MAKQAPKSEPDSNSKRKQFGLVELVTCNDLNYFETPVLECRFKVLPKRDTKQDKCILFFENDREGAAGRVDHLGS